MKIGKQRQTCCSTCPFARTTSKEYLDTRGDNGTRFVGQAHIPALLPCHMENADQIADPLSGQGQCAGAAIFRANVGVADRLPPQMGRLPEDREIVFSSAAELLAHHKGWSLKRAEEFLKRTPAEELGRREMARAMALGRVAAVRKA